ncbi:MAG: hypothetical protein AB1414_20335 [bacterium]
MGGSFLNNTNITEKIDRWIINNIKDKKYLQYDDFHIDEVDLSLTLRENWIPGSIKCLKTALESRNKRQLPFTVALAFSLKSKETPIGANFQTPDELEQEFDITPPSLYLFPKGSEPWVIDFNDFLLIDLDLFRLKGLDVKCFYAENLIGDDDEYRRSLWLVG